MKKLSKLKKENTDTIRGINKALMYAIEMYKDHVSVPDDARRVAYDMTGCLERARQRPKGYENH
jgi:hypothetical protein